jgi:hypothetical protein
MFTTAAAAAAEFPPPPLELDERRKSARYIRLQRHHFFERLAQCVRECAWDELHKRLNHETALPILLQEAERCARLFCVALECSGDLQATLTELRLLTARLLQSVAEEERLAARRAELKQSFCNCASVRLLSVFPLRVLRRHLHSHMMSAPIADGHLQHTSLLLSFAQLYLACTAPSSAHTKRTKAFRQFVEVGARNLALQHDRGQLYLLLRERLQLRAAQVNEDVQRALRCDACDVLRALLDHTNKSTLGEKKKKKKKKKKNEDDDDDDEDQEEEEATTSTQVEEAQTESPEPLLLRPCVAWLHLAIQQDSCGCVELLIEHHHLGDPTLASPDLHVVVERAVWRQLRASDPLGSPLPPCARVLRTLLRYFAPQLQPTLDQVNMEHGLTPLQACCDRYALKSGHGRAYAECAQALVEAGASFEHVVYRGLSCWELATQQNRLVDELVFARVGTRKRAEFPSLRRTRMPSKKRVRGNDTVFS